MGKLRSLDDPEELTATIRQELKNNFGEDITFFCGWFDKKDGSKTFAMGFYLKLPEDYIWEERIQVPKPYIDLLMKPDVSDWSDEYMHQPNNQLVLMQFDFKKHHYDVNQKHGGSKYSDLRLLFGQGFHLMFDFQ
ncbi:MAG: hypothetical protein HUK20_13595 [Fibrobacter sp.]|nr:hypothetical protein [Fibrobacter sp.]